MKLETFLEFAGVELSNGARVSRYVTDAGVTGLSLPTNCGCAAIDEGYMSVASDPAPWYEPTRPESEEFLGFFAHTMRLLPVSTRAVTPTGRLGSYISPPALSGQQVQVTGALIAETARGMAYGQRWLREVLRGSNCSGGGCATDTACILEACPDDPTDLSGLRTLVDVGCIDGPTMAPVGVPEQNLMEVSFNLVSSKPWSFAPLDTCVDAETLVAGATALSCALTTPQWMGEGVFVIDLTNIDSAATTGITITGRISLDGSCPVTGDGLSVPPAFTYTIPSLGPEDRIVIDGMRRQANYYDASEKVASSALPYMSWEGGFPWPEVGACTTMCIEVSSTGGGDMEVTVQTALREL